MIMANGMQCRNKAQEHTGLNIVPNYIRPVGGSIGLNNLILPENF